MVCSIARREGNAPRTPWCLSEGAGSPVRPKCYLERHFGRNFVSSDLDFQTLLSGIAPI
jgi:hypothetical protein